jgi:hypothetical protein
MSLFTTVYPIYRTYYMSKGRKREKEKVRRENRVKREEIFI